MPRKRTGTARAKRTTTRRKMLQGGNIFGDLWSGLKSTVAKPSTWLGAAGMLPTPLAPALRAGSIIGRLTGNGRRRRRTGAKRQRGGRMIGATLSN